MKRPWQLALCAGALALTTLLAHAQYSWIDEKGARVFSDRPPPPGTPSARILKAPREPVAVPPAASTPAAPDAPVALMAPPAPPAPAAAAAVPVPDWKQREQEFQARRAKRAQEDQLAAKKHSEQLARCAWARGAKAQLDSGRRLEWTNKDGKRETMSAQDRSDERRHANDILAQCV